MKKNNNNIYHFVFWLVIISGLIIGFNSLIGTNVIQNLFPQVYRYIYILIGILAIILVVLETKKNKQNFIIIPPGGYPYVGGWNDKWALWFFR
jgi:uncharacterized membrane protein YuzA (DUF378 family)